MNGRVFRHDDVAWSVAYPPNGWRCRAKPFTDAALQRDGLVVGTGDGYVRQVDVPQRDGSVLKVKRLALPGMDKPFQPDAGWAYNPAADYHGSDQ